MKPITNTTELRWYLEDLGEEHKALREYVLGRIDYFEEVHRLAESTITRLAAAEHLCEVASRDYFPVDADAIIVEIGNTVHDVKEDWKYTMEDM